MRIIIITFVCSLCSGNKPAGNTPNGLSPLANKSVNIPLSNNDAKHLNNVESGGKTIEDEENDSNNRFDMRNCCQNFVDRTFTKKQLNRKLPITEWAPKYNVECFVSDLIAGITVALTVIPQGIAYALIAELPPQVSQYRNHL